MKQELLDAVLNLIAERADSPMKKFEEAFPEYREASEKTANLYNFVTDILKNDEIEMTIAQKRDILSYLDSYDTVEMYSELIFYLTGVSDGIKLMEFFG